jgi:hypothetical protein
VEEWEATDDAGKVVRSGSVLCHRGSASSLVVWTDEQLKIIGIAFRNDRNIALILGPWREGNLDPSLP